MTVFQVVRFLLFPFAFLYGIVVRLRHFLYDYNILKSVSFSVPTICVGNISFGGTGKTPMIEYLISRLEEKYNIGVISRGYKRKSKGFFYATPESSVEDLGDEPYQFWRKFPFISLAVDANRVNGIKKMLQINPEIEVVLLDDAFQHRRVKALKNIVLTDYNHLFLNDFLLPVGTLRDVVARVKKADILVVTKCPSYLSENEMIRLQEKVKQKNSQKVFFTKIAYAEKVYSQTESVDFQQFIKEPFTLITGIANPKPLLEFLDSQKAVYKHLKFADHHHFSATEMEHLKTEKRILTTEKDFVRLQNKLPQAFYLPIEMDFIREEDKQQFLKFISKF